MDPIAATFAQRFANWQIALPQTALQQRQPGHISARGWLIQYCFGDDDTRVFLDYYAAHRMSDDEHVRIHADGSIVELPSLHAGYAIFDDPDRTAASRARCFEYNRKLASLLAQKGFGLASVNMAIASGVLEDAPSATAAPST